MGGGTFETTFNPDKGSKALLFGRANWEPSVKSRMFDDLDGATLLCVSDVETQTTAERNDAAKCRTGRLTLPRKLCDCGSPKLLKMRPNKVHNMRDTGTITGDE